MKCNYIEPAGEYLTFTYQSYQCDEEAIVLIDEYPVCEDHFNKVGISKGCRIITLQENNKFPVANVQHGEQPDPLAPPPTNKCSNCEYLKFIIDYLYDALGPAADDIMEMAEETWESK